MIPGLIGTLTMIQTLMLTAMSVAREREQGTFDQLLVTPFRPAEIMAGKALPSMVVGIIQATGVLLVAQLWFRIPFQGSFLTLYAGLTLFVLAAVGIGLVVSAFCYTMQQAMLFAFVIIMPFALLSGLTTPLSNMPSSLQYFTYANPLALCHRHRAAGVPGGSRAERPDARPVAAGGHRRGHAGRRFLDVQAPPTVRSIMANSNSMAIARPVALAFLGCTLAGCVVGPNFVKPKPSVPPQWSPTAVANGTEGAARVTSERAQTVAWWSSFNDATLTALVQQSAAQNLDIKQAVLRIEEAQAQTAVVAGGLWPTCRPTLRGRVSGSAPIRRMAPFSA